MMLQRVGNSRCVRCDFETSADASFEQQDAAMMEHLTDKHPDWMIDGGKSILPSRMPKDPQCEIAELQSQLSQLQGQRDRLVEDLSMLVQRLCRRIAKDMFHGASNQLSNQKMIDAAYDFLRRKGINGSIFREAEAALSNSSQPSQETK